MHSSMGSMSCYGLGNAVDITQLAVQQSISAMWNRHGEQLSLDELADCAILSKFYFSRVFRSATGTSPGRFLTAIRLFKTKNLLLETSLHVTDIAYRVGYSSLGTFTSRFTRSVGVSPGRYRAMAAMNLHAVPGKTCTRSAAATVSGNVLIPTVSPPMRIYVCAFRGSAFDGLPAACTVIDHAGRRTVALLSAPFIRENIHFVRTTRSRMRARSERVRTSWAACPKATGASTRSPWAPAT